VGSRLGRLKLFNHAAQFLEGDVLEVILPKGTEAVGNSEEEILGTS
jgi:hypothetical protein